MTLEKLTLDSTIIDRQFKIAFCDLGASINLISFSIVKKLELGDAINKTEMIIQLANHPIRRPRGVIEDVFVKVDKFILSMDFEILAIKEDPEIPIIFGHY